MLDTLGGSTEPPTGWRLQRFFVIRLSAAPGACPRVEPCRRGADMAPIVWLTLTVVGLFYVVLGVWAVATIFPTRADAQREGTDAHQPPLAPADHTGDRRPGGPGSPRRRSLAR